jgi:hypothetical protein
MTESALFLTDSEVSALAETLQQNTPMTADYELRGRPHCQMTLSELNDRWISAYREVFGDKSKAAVRDMSDYFAEFQLRGLRRLPDRVHEIPGIQDFGNPEAKSFWLFKGFRRSRS